MDITTTPSGAAPARGRRHLIPGERVAQVLALPSYVDADLSRHHGQGNGIRVHALLFSGVSLGVLVAFVFLIAIASGRM